MSIAGIPTETINNISWGGQAELDEVSSGISQEQQRVRYERRVWH